MKPNAPIPLPGGLMMLPAAPGHCPVCFAKHGADQIHDARSLSYAVRFSATYGRSVTWADAAAHLTPSVASEWRAKLGRLGIEWTEPPAGSDPNAEAIE